MASSTYCVVPLLWFFPSCVPYVANFSGFCPFLIVPPVFSYAYHSIVHHKLYLTSVLENKFKKDQSMSVQLHIL